MLLKKCTSIILYALFFCSDLNAQLIDPFLINEWKQKDQIDCVIVLNSQADLSLCTSKISKAEKGLCVYDLLVHHRSITQSGIIKFLSTSKIEHQAFTIINAIQAELTKPQAELLVEKFEIKNIASNPWTSLDPGFENESLSPRDAGEPEWGIKMIEAQRVWDLGYTGQNIVVAGQDTGYEWDHPLIVSKYRGVVDTDTIHDFNWHDAIRELNPLLNDSIIEPFTNPCGLNSSVPCDDHGHGSHTVGTMVGSSEEDLIGVAPGAKWIGCRNMDRGYGKPSTYLECFEWFLAPTDLENKNPNPGLAPHVINNSWSCPEEEGCNASNWEVLDLAIKNLRAAGIVVISSAGNEGSNCFTINRPPSMFDSSFTVGATGKNDSIANFSSRGPVSIDSSFRIKPDIAAPGVDVRSINLNNSFKNRSGTSMAGPHVAGTVALMLSANPNLIGDVDRVEQILRASAVAKYDTSVCNSVMGSDVPNHVYGHGRLNAFNAVELALESSASIEPPQDSESSIRVFPNPGKDYIFVKNESPEVLKIELINQRAQSISSKNIMPFEQAQIQLKNIPKGIYFINWYSKARSGIEKIILN